LTVAVHVLAGAVGLVFGYVALYAPKGEQLHRSAGRVFVSAMLTMAILGMVIAALRGVWREVNIPAGWTTAYLAITALATVRRPAGWSRRLDVGLMLVALAVGLTMLTFGIQAVAAGGKRGEIPAFPFVLFGLVGLVAGAGDVRVIRAGALSGARRLARHLWRMSFALFIAAMSFFFGQADELPRALRIPPLLALPVVAVLVTMLYWLWRVRVRRTGPGRAQGIVAVKAA
jgi:uncharacterized membrane protein